MVNSGNYPHISWISMTSIDSVEHQHVGQDRDGSAGRVAAHNS